jgi:hypothetical protein
LGNRLDGGYVLSNKIIKKCDFLLSFGLGDNWTFEKDLKKINPQCRIYAYDHTINFFYWVRHFFFWFWKSIRFRKYIKFLLFIEYIFFFKLKNNKHYKILSANYWQQSNYTTYILLLGENSCNKINKFSL